MVLCDRVGRDDVRGPIVEECHRQTWGVESPRLSSDDIKQINDATIGCEAPSETDRSYDLFCASLYTIHQKKEQIPEQKFVLRGLSYNPVSLLIFEKPKRRN